MFHHFLDFCAIFYESQFNIFLSDSESFDFDKWVCLILHFYDDLVFFTEQCG